MIRSKAAVTTAELGDQYCLIGPYNESCVRLEVEVMEPELTVMKETVEALRSEGVKVRTFFRNIFFKCVEGAFCMASNYKCMRKDFLLCSSGLALCRTYSNGMYDPI